MQEELTKLVLIALAALPGDNPLTGTSPPASGGGGGSPPPPPPVGGGNGGTANRYDQCGGNGWTGPTRCVSPYTCRKQNDWYSQCL